MGRRVRSVTINSASTPTLTPRPRTRSSPTADANSSWSAEQDHPSWLSYTGLRYGDYCARREVLDRVK